MTARARTTDPVTSHLAAASVSQVNSTKVRAAILAILDEGGPATDEQVAEQYAALPAGIGVPASPSGLRTRRRELAAAGLILDTGRREPTAAGRPAIVWAAGFVCPGCEQPRPLREAQTLEDGGDYWCTECREVLRGA